MRPSTTAYSTSLSEPRRDASSSELRPAAFTTWTLGATTGPSVRGTPRRTDRACACCGVALAEAALAASARMSVEPDLYLTITRASLSAAGLVVACLGHRSAALGTVAARASAA